HRMTGITDLVVPTFTPGRAPAWTQSIVGSFFNLVPLRTDIAGCVTFRDVVGRARATCLSAYAHELPFIQVLEVAPELMLPAAHEDFCATVFQVVQSPFMMAGERVGELNYTAMRRRLRSQHIGSEIPDGALWELEPHPAGGIVGSVGFCRSQFDEATVAGLAEGLQQTLQTCLSEPDRPLDRD
ncbi:MAG TPA: condensation domain-containing protein, partial [Micromonosporaceae bacterium]